MNSFIENVNYLASLDNNYGDGIVLNKNNLSLRNVANDVTLKFSYFNYNTKQIETVDKIINGMFYTGLETALQEFCAKIKSSLGGNKFYASFTIYGHNISITINSLDEKLKCTEINFNAKITSTQVEIYNLYGDVINPLKLLSVLAMLEPEVVNAIPMVYEKIDSITYINSNIDLFNDIKNNIIPNINEILEADNNALIASQKALDASASALSALSSATTATTKATNASNSATNAATSATSSSNSATTATAQATIATTKAGEASASATSAATSSSNAATSATSATASSTNATTKASEAATSATNAAASSASATTSATSAATSATTATTKANQALTSANDSATSATNASISETQSATSAGQSATSASSAANSAADASASAIIASTQASTATTKAAEALVSASEAETSRNQAETFKNNASVSATKASQWAENNYNAAVEAGKYSAKHWATVAQNTVSGKVDKVTSTDNAIVRFNGTTGDVQNSNITVDDIGNIGTGTQSFNGFGGSGFKNYIINGGFNVNQYPAYSATDGYKIDRWVISGASSINNIIQGQLNSEAESDKGLVVSKNSTSAAAYIVQKIEFPRRLAGKKVTVSFKCYSPNTFNGTIYFDKYNPTDGLSNAANVQTFSWSTSWNKYSLTFTLPTLGTNYNHKDSSFQLVFSIPQAVTTTGAWLTDVQLELGSVATPFEQRPYGLELSLCQRYFRSLGLNTSWYSIGAGGVNTGIVVDTTCGLPIPMRRNPDLSVVGAYSNYSLTDGVSVYTPTSITIQDNSTDCITIRSLYSGGTAGRSVKLMTTTANGGILLNAEL